MMEEERLKAEAHGHHGEISREESKSGGVIMESKEEVHKFNVSRDSNGACET
jgi:hypothetical protein